ncbi:MAG: hypothetical protein GY861_06370 [bacterium]|nr:hypothetical protein [bacterium]
MSEIELEEPVVDSGLDNLFAQLDAKGLTQGAPEAQKETAIAKTTALMQTYRTRTAGYGCVDGLRESVREVVAVQTALDKKIKIENSPALRAGYSLKNKIGEFFGDKKFLDRYSIDDLWDMQLDAVGQMAYNLHGVALKSRTVLDGITKKKAEKFYEFTTAINTSTQLEDRLNESNDLYDATCQQLKRTKIADPGYGKLETARENLESEMGQVKNNLLKSKSAVVFLDEEMNLLKQYKLSVENVTHNCDRFRENVERTQELSRIAIDSYRFCRDTAAEMGELFPIMDQLGNTVMNSVEQFGEMTNSIAKMTTATDSGYLRPGNMGKMLEKYTSSIMLHEGKRNSEIEGAADRIMNSCGL